MPGAKYIPAFLKPSGGLIRLGAGESVYFLPAIGGASRQLDHINGILGFDLEARRPGCGQWHATKALQGALETLAEHAILLQNSPVAKGYNRPPVAAAGGADTKRHSFIFEKCEQPGRRTGVMNGADGVCNVKDDHARPHAMVSSEAFKAVGIFVVGHKRNRFAELGAAPPLPTLTHAHRAIGIKTIAAELSEQQFQGPVSRTPRGSLQLIEQRLRSGEAQQFAAGSIVSGQRLPGHLM